MQSGLDHRHTLFGAYVANVTQAVIYNLPPLLFVVWNQRFGISLAALGLLISVNFGVQVLVNLATTRVVDAVGYRVSMVSAHAFATIGLVSIGALPFVMDPYLGLVIGTAITALGAGFLQVVVSPVVQAAPTSNKAFHMGLLHSFYCWGFVAVVAVSTLVLVGLGFDHWPVLLFMWALVPAFNTVFLTRVPFYPVTGESAPMGLRRLFASRLLWLMIVMMMAAGASEQGLGQWVSTYATTTLGFSKAVGDLAGPLVFAASEGLARVVFSSRATTETMSRIMLKCLVAAVLSYVLMAVSPWPWLGVVAVMIGGFSVGILWPGGLTIAAARFPLGGTAMFAILSLGGNIGVSTGPALMGIVADRGGGMASGLLFGALIPALMFAVVGYGRWRTRGRRRLARR